MSTSDAPARWNSRLHWGWMLVGVLLGAVLITTFVGLVWSELPRPNVSILVGGLTFILTGVFVAYFSPGETILEPALSGIVLAALTGIVLALVVGMELTPLLVGVGLPAGFLLAMLGGWVGELMQGTLRSSEATEGIQWPWIAVGIVLGAILNAYFVFGGRALVGFSPLGVLVAFSASFVIAGLFVGLFSPGVTLLEPALAGLGLVALDVVITRAGLGAPFPVQASAEGIREHCEVCSSIEAWPDDLARICRTPLTNHASRPQ